MVERRFACLVCVVAVLLGGVVCVWASGTALNENVGSGWSASGGVVAEFSRKRSHANFDEGMVREYSLPDPLVSCDGEAIRSSGQWLASRRPEILELFRTQVYGRAPGVPDDIRFRRFDLERDALKGVATRKQVKVYFSGDKSGPSMDILIYLPNSADGPVPLFIGLNFGGNHTIHADPGIALTSSWVRNSKDSSITDNRATEKSRGASSSRWPVEEILARGYGLATVYYGDIDPDFDDGFLNGGHGLLDAASGEDRPADAWGSIAAWAWGLSRAMDYFETDGDIDHNRIALMGHSRLGKTALWAGGRDRRFAIVISNCSGCGGAAISRRRYGESVARINTSFPHWFCGNFKDYSDNEDQLDVDQHMLIALVAPRPVYVASADEDLWADPKGEFTAAKAAEPVYRLLDAGGLDSEGIPPLGHATAGTIGHHIRAGKHDVTDFEWGRYLDFADKHLKKLPWQYTFEPVDRLEPQPDMPDPFVGPDGNRITSRKQWPGQREYLKAMLAHYQYGRMPPKPGNLSVKQTSAKKVLGGSATDIRLTLTFRHNAKSLDLRVGILRPNGPGPFPVVIKNDRQLFDEPVRDPSMQSKRDIGRYEESLAGYRDDMGVFEEAARRGYAICKFVRTDLAEDDMGHRNVGVFPMYPDYDWGVIAAWAWGYQLVIDALAGLDFVDMEKIVATGHSRGGKTALCAGIYDERITLCAPNSSGTGGTGSLRYFEQDQRQQVISVHILRQEHWWAQRFMEFSDNAPRLPFDSHFNKALIAPHGLINPHARQDYWANPYGTELTSRAAEIVFDWLGCGDNIAMHWRQGEHAQGPEDWRALLDFADGYFFGRKPARRFDVLAYPDARLPVRWKAPSLR